MKIIEKRPLILHRLQEDLSPLSLAGSISRGILLTAPKVWLAGAEESVCVSLHGLASAVTGQAILQPRGDSATPLVEREITFHGGMM